MLVSIGEQTQILSNWRTKLTQCIMKRHICADIYLSVKLLNLLQDSLPLLAFKLHCLHCGSSTVNKTHLTMKT